jgi:hypothetical protein
VTADRRTFRPRPALANLPPASDSLPRDSANSVVSGIATSRDCYVAWRPRSSSERKRPIARHTTRVCCAMGKIDERASIRSTRKRGPCPRPKLSIEGSLRTSFRRAPRFKEPETGRRKDTVRAAAHGVDSDRSKSTSRATFGSKRKSSESPSRFEHLEASGSGAERSQAR